MRLEKVFKHIFNTHAFDDEIESVSGKGSTLRATEKVRKELLRLVGEKQIETVFDAACGDFNWMSDIVDEFDYQGMDIVPKLIDENRKLFPDQNFMVGNFCEDPLPKADLIICRDALVHLPLYECLQALRNFKASGSTYVLMTTFPMKAVNPEVLAGSWRPLNMKIYPFNLPEPEYTINEGWLDDGEHYSDKSLGLWKLQGLTV